MRKAHIKMDQTSESEKIFQRKKYDEIIEILFQAGYHRVRINTLSEFDKVVGGLCWCITSTGEDVDVDILFQENSTIGQKIALAESIVKAMRKMSCPFPLQPHQIQGGVGGSDYSAIQPVMFWLVKKFIERRNEIEAKLRSYSISQFAKSYQLPSEQTNEDGMSNELRKILGRNKVVRSYRRRELPKQSEEIRVHACLLEYGESIARNFESSNTIVSASGSTSTASIAGASAATSSVSSNASSVSQKPTNNSKLPNSNATTATSTTTTTTGSSSLLIPISDNVDVSLSNLLKNSNSSELSQFEKKLIHATKEAQKEEKLFVEQVNKTELEILQQMSEVKVDENNANNGVTIISGSHVGAIVGLNSNEIGTAQALYQLEVEETKKQLDTSLAEGKLGQNATLKRQKALLTRVQEDNKQKSIELQNSIKISNEKYALLQQEVEETKEYNQQLKLQVNKLIELENNSSQQKDLLVLKELIVLNESLKNQESSFKANCKTELMDLTQQLEVIEGILENENNEENQRYHEIEEMHQKIMLKYDRLRQLLSETNLEVANTSRLIDDIPTRTELIQYERRFGELYQQVAWKLEENRKYFDLYNTLETSLSFIQKEVSLLPVCCLCDSLNKWINVLMAIGEIIKFYF